MTAAAFFDVDRTLLAGASSIRLAAPLRRRGMLTSRQLARTLIGGLVFSMQGSDDAELDRYSEILRELMRGWDRATLVEVVEQELEKRVHPTVFREAIQRIEQHRAKGEPVYAVSATSSEIIEPLAHLLELDGYVATELEVVDGAFTGEIARPNHGPAKAERLREFAAANDIDLARSSAYSDSITDEQFLRAVGKAYAVNPDKALRRLAEEEGWGILRFSTRIRAPFHARRSTRIGVGAVVAGIALHRARQRRRR